MHRLCLAAVLTLGAALGLGGCSKSYDAWFANPCAHRVRVTTLYVVRDGTASKASDDVIAVATLRHGEVTKVKDAFQDANGFAWFVRIDGGPTLRITKAQMPKWIVSLPASVCTTA